MEPGSEREELRRDPAEWHRRGMYHPDELARIVQQRILHGQTGIVYADFFTHSIAEVGTHAVDRHTV